MQKHYQGHSLNYLIAALCLALIAISSYKLFYNKNKLSNYFEHQSIGKIQNHQNLVKIKKFDQIAWFDIKKNMPLHPNDLIFTDKSSHLIFTLQYGIQITLLEQTMVEIQNETEISIGKGEIELTLSDINRPLTININNIRYQLKSSNAEFKISTKNKASQIKVNKGTLEVKNLKTQRTQKATVLSSVILDDIHPSKNKISYTQKGNKNPIHIIPLRPKNNSTQITYQKENTIHFKWKQIKRIKKYYLEIYDNKNKVILEKKISGTQFAWKTKQIGNFHWSLRPLNENILINKIPWSHFTLKYQMIKDNRPIVFELIKPNQEVEFKWNNSKHAHYHHFQLANDPEFKNIIIDKKIFTNRTKINFPKTGVYYWKVKAKAKDGSSLPTKPVKVLIRPTPPPSKPKPLPNLKLKVKHEHNSDNDWSSFFISHAYAAGKKRIKLDWPALSNAKFYHIEIYTDKALKNKIKHIKSKQSFYYWKYERTGKFYWRYRIEDFWGRLSPYSDVSELYLKTTNFHEKTSQNQKPTKSYIQKLDHYINEHKEKKKKHILFVAPASNQVSYLQKGNQNYKISGTTFSGLYTDYLYRLNSINHISASLQHHSGQAYQDQNFLFQRLNTFYHFPFHGSFLYSGVSLLRFSTYKQNGQTPQLKQQQLSALFSVGAKYLWQNYPILSYLNLSFRNKFSYDIGIRYRFYGNSKFSLSTDFSYQNIQFKAGKNEIETQQFQLAIGPKFKF